MIVLVFIKQIFYFLWRNKSALGVVVTVSGVTYMSISGYESNKRAPKMGVVWHSQGDTVSVESWNLPDSSAYFSEWMFDYSANHVCEGRSSYHAAIVGDSIFTSQDERHGWEALLCHVRGYNSPSIGILLALTNDTCLNNKTVKTAYVLHDSINKWSMDSYGIDLQFSLMHADLDPKRRTDPQGFIPMLEKIHYDHRIKP